MRLARILRRRRGPAGQRGMTLIETLLAVMLSSLMVLPMMGWGSLALKEQVNTQERNLSGSALGLLRAYFVRDVTTATWAAVEGSALDECASGEKGDVTVLMLAHGDQRIGYRLRSVDGFTSTLQRIRCAKAGGVEVESIDLAGDVIAGGTATSCSTDDQLSELAASIGLDLPLTGQDEIGKGSPRCRRVTLQLTTERLTRVALSATVRSGGITDIPAVAAPTAVATASPTSGPRRLKVQFSGKESTDPDGEKLAFEWDFGDGERSAEAAPTHAFSTIGTTTVTLTVTNESGLSDTTELDVTVTDNAPVAVIASPTSGTTVSRGEKVAFSPKGSNDDLDGEFGGRIVAHQWDFGDGTTSTDTEPTKVYAEVSPPEGYAVTLTVVDDAGQKATATSSVIVANRAPTVSLDVDPPSGTAPLTVTFAAEVTDEEFMDPAPSLAYAWDFGDGTTSSEAAPPPHTYSKVGEWAVTLVVTDDQGATATAEEVVTVEEAAPSTPSGLRKLRSGRSGGTRFIDLGFTAVPGATDYEVRITCISKKCSTVASNTGTTTTIRISGLENRGRTWHAQVRALGKSGQWSEWSETVRVST